MIFFDQTEYSKIPIWENKRRIKALTVFRDLYLDLVLVSPGNRIPLSPTTGQPFRQGEQRSEINQRKPAIQNMVALAKIRAFRATVRRDGSPVDIDVLAHLWELETCRVSVMLPVDAIEEAIGVYRDDQAKSRFRTFNPFFWLARLIDWVADWIFNVLVALVGADPQKAKSSGFGRVFNALKDLTLWIATVGGAIVAVLELLGYQTAIRRFFHLE
jgi:hypothetical protein